jgi:ribonuclease HIII
MEIQYQSYTLTALEKFMNIEEQSKTKIETLKSTMLDEGLNVSSIQKRQYNFEFTVSNDSDEKLKVQVYFGKKGVKVVLQGNNESEFYSFINSIVFEQTELPLNTSTEIDFDNYIGSDETGKGDLFGPLVICAFHYEESMYNSFGKLGIQDSKNMSQPQIQKASLGLMKQFPENFEVVIILPAKYNELYDKFRNLNKLLNWAHTKAIDNLLERSSAKNIIVDKFSNEQLNLQNSGMINIVQTHKGERYSGVAAASIIARFHFDKWFVKNSKFGLLKGASNETAKVAQKIFDSYGIDELKNVAKLHFKSIKNYIE